MKIILTFLFLFFGVLAFSQDPPPVNGSPLQSPTFKVTPEDTLIFMRGYNTVKNVYENFNLATQSHLKIYKLKSDSIVNSGYATQWDLKQFTSNDSINQLLKGTVVWVSGLTFNVSDCKYLIQGTTYNSLANNITLDASDVTNPRIDVIYVDIYGNIGFIKGLAEANPAKPIVDPLSQLELTSVLIPANATEPSGITNQVVYDENIEWAGSQVTTYAGVTVAFNNTSSPFTGIYQTRISKTGASFGTASFKYLKSGSLYSAQGATLIMSIRTSKAFTSTSSIVLTLKAYDTTVGSSVVIKNGRYGFVAGTSYQTIAIPFADFVPNANNINTLYINFTGSFPSGSMNIDFDNIYFQDGVTPLGKEIDPIFSKWLASYDPSIFKLKNDSIVNSGYFTNWKATFYRTLNNHDSLSTLQERSYASLTNIPAKVDTIYRTPGKDSLQFKINNRYYAVKDSIGGGGPNLTVQGLSGTTPSWSGTSGINATLTLSGNTTVTLSNLTAGTSGNITITNDATTYTLTFSGYTNKISPVVYSATNVVLTSGGSKIDVFSWYYDGNYLIWNGTLDYN